MSNEQSGVSSKERVLLVTQYFYPENFKSNDIAFELVKRGYDVDVLAGIPNYPEGRFYKGYGIFSKRIEKIDGVNVYRAFQTPRGRKASSIGLALNYLSFVFFASFWAIWLSVTRQYKCIIVHQSSPITQAIPAIIVKKFKRIPLYTWVLDLWPDSVLSNTENSLIISILTKLTNYVYKQSTKILISSSGFNEFIPQKYKSVEDVIYFPNWSENIKEMSKCNIPILPDGFVIMMAGNLGRAQNLDVILSVALLLKSYKEIKFVFVGDGSCKKNIDEFVQQHNLLSTVITLGKYPYTSMPAFYERADLMLISLKTDRAHLSVTIPARLQSYMAAGKPILGIIDGGVADMIRDAHCGYYISPYNHEDIASLIVKIKDSSDLNLLGENGYNYFLNNFTKQGCIDNLVKIIQTKC